MTLPFLLRAPIPLLVTAVLSFCIAGSNFASAAQPRLLPDTTITLDARRLLSETGGDDLAAGRRIFAGASAPEANGGIEPAWPILSGIGMSAVRIINDPEQCILNAAGQLDECYRLSGNLDTLRRHSLNPHIVVGQRQPRHIAPPAYEWGSTEWDQYRDYAEKVVRYVAAEFAGTGFEETIVEVGQEIDVSVGNNDLWTLPNQNIPQGHPARYEHYMRLFRVWSAAVDSVAKENPGKRVLVAGPAMGGQGLFLNGRMFHTNFIAQVAAERLRLDIVSHHFFGDLLQGWPFGPRSDLKTQLLTIQEALAANDLASTPIYITEFGPNDTLDQSNYTHASAVWSAMFLYQALSAGVRGGSYLIARDVFGGDPSGWVVLPSLTHVRDWVDYSKPNTNVFKMFHMLPGTRRGVAVSSNQPNVRGIGGVSQSAAGLLVFNYALNFWTRATWDEFDRSAPETIRVGFRGLPFSGRVIVERYLVDRNTSNLGRLIDEGIAPTHAQTELTKVEEYRARVVSGRLVLDATLLDRAATSLWIIRRF